MKWFKHYSNARFDPKIRRLINKYGIEGYGLYFAIVESISFQLETEKPMPDLEENANDIAEFFKMNLTRVEEILKYCVSPESELFEFNQDTGRLMCLKLLTHLDNTMSNNPEIKKIINNFKKLEETSSGLKQIRLDKIRLDKTRLDKDSGSIPKNIKEISDYCIEKGYKDIDPDYFWNYYQARGWKYKTGQPMKDWKAAINTWRKNNKSKKSNNLDTVEGRVSRVEELKKIIGE